MADTPESTALALGKLIGTVEGVMKTLEGQNIASAKSREEQNQTAIKTREEFMEIFKGIREDNKEQGKAVIELMNWRKTAEPDLNDLVNSQNRQKGAMAAMGFMGTLFGGSIMAIMEYLKKN